MEEVLLKSTAKRVINKVKRSRTAKPTSVGESLKIPLSVKKGKSTFGTHLFLDNKKKQYVSSFGNKGFNSSCPEGDKLYFKTPNLESNFTKLPTGSILQQSLEEFRSLQVNYNIQSSPELEISIYVMCYSETERVKGLQHKIQSLNSDDPLSGRVFFKIPEGAKNLGIALRVIGEGNIVIHDLAIKSSKLKQIEVDPLLKAISKDSNPFIQQAALYGVSEYPDLAHNTFRILMKLIDDRREQAVLAIADKYEEDLGVSVHRVRTHALNRLLKMADSASYYEKLPTDVKRDPLLLRRYQKALNWVSRNEELRASIVELMSYPGSHSNLIPNLLLYAELLNDDELAILTQIVLNNNVDHLDFFNLLCFNDLLLSRDKTLLSQSLAKVLDYKFKKHGKEGRINYYLMLSNIAYRHKNHSDQLYNINKALQTSGLLPVSLINDKHPVSANNIYCEKDEAYISKVTTDGPLITVIMTSWNSLSSIEYAVNSILNQTYQNIELIIVDDASDDMTPKLIKKIAKKDSRIVPLLLTQNGGTYVAKNHGRKIAKGEYITCQDSDDWAHPEKLQRLLDIMQENDEYTGVECGHVRISPKRGLQVRAAGSLRKDASSLMYRRKQIDEHIGFYDSIRAGGDGEFKFRIQRYFGPNTIRFRKDLLSIVAWEDGTLSGRGSEFEISSIGVFKSSRLAYRQQFSESHEYGEFLIGKHSFYRSQNPDEGRIFELNS